MKVVRKVTAFSYLGGIAVKAAQLEKASEMLRNIRHDHNTFGEVKWRKISNAKLDFYKAYVDVFFELAPSDILHFHSLYVDSGTFNHKKWNQSDHEIGFNKLIYQLLLHKFGRRYGEKSRIYVYLDERTAKTSPDYITPILNSGLAKDWGITSSPFRRTTFQNSKSSEILQLNDLLIGAIGFRKNSHHQKAGASPAKIAFATHVATRAAKLQHPVRVTSSHAKLFSIWPFAYKKEVLEA